MCTCSFRQAAAAAVPRLADGTELPATGDWQCRLCLCKNYAYRPTCAKCGAAGPLSKPKTKDILKCNDREVVGFICEKLHPNINRAFLAIGTPFSNGKVGSSGPDAIVAAFQQRGEERMCRVVRILSDTDNFLECAEHFYGNYTVQDVLASACCVREALGDRHAYLLDAFRAQNGGHDLVGALLYAALPHVKVLGRHEKGECVRGCRGGRAWLVACFETKSGQRV